MRTCDKNNRPIQVGDVLKVYHFTGARRKRHFMYKQVVGTELLGGWGGAPKVAYFKVSHLGMSDPNDTGYWMGMNEGVMSDYEIVQGWEPHFMDREKIT